MTHPKSINGLRIADGLDPIVVEKNDPLYRWYNSPPEAIVAPFPPDDFEARIKRLNGESA